MPQSPPTLPPGPVVAVGPRLGAQAPRPPSCRPRLSRGDARSPRTGDALARAATAPRPSRRRCGSLVPSRGPLVAPACRCVPPRRPGRRGSSEGAGRRMGRGRGRRSVRDRARARQRPLLAAAREYQLWHRSGSVHHAGYVSIDSALGAAHRALGAEGMGLAAYDAAMLFWRASSTWTTVARRRRWGRGSATRWCATGSHRCPRSIAIAWRAWPGRAWARTSWRRPPACSRSRRTPGRRRVDRARATLRRSRSWRRGRSCRSWRGGVCTRDTATSSTCSRWDWRGSGSRTRRAPTRRSRRRGARCPPTNAGA